MALSLGTNCGFVSAAPTGDPNGNSITADSYAWAVEHEAPSTGTITHIGIYINSGSSSGLGFDVGIYQDDNANSEPGALISSETSSMDFSAGWNEYQLSTPISVTKGTKYWVAFQIDNSTTHYLDIASSGGQGYARLSAQSSLPDPDWGSSLSTDADGMAAIYGVIKAQSAGQDGPYVY